MSKTNWSVIQARYEELMKNRSNIKLRMKNNYKAVGIDYSAEGMAIFDNGTHAEIYTPEGKTISFYKPLTTFTRL